MDEWVGRGQIRGEPDWAHGFGSPALSSPRGGHGRRSHKRKSPNSPGTFTAWTFQGDGLPRGYSKETGRGPAAGCHVDIPWR